MTDPITGAIDNDHRVNPPPDLILLAFMQIALFYSLYHDLFQLYTLRGEYFAEKWNYLDIIYLMLGFYNIFLQYMGGTWELNAKLTFICLV
jgi:hypothetical protein